MNIAARIALAIVACALATPVARAQQAPGQAAFDRGISALEAGEAWDARGHFERAIHEGYPRGPGYRALADAYLELDNRLFFAREALERSLEESPGDIAGWYLLADINLRLDGGDADDRARAAFREVFRLDPFYQDAYERWRRLYLDPDDLKATTGILDEHLAEAYDPRIALRRVHILYDVGEYEEAAREIERFRETVEDRDRWRARLEYLQGVVLAALEQPVEGHERYFEGLAAARTEDDLAPFYEDVEPLLSEEEISAWEEGDPGARRAFLQGWWNRRDPLPLSDVNERWVEQQHRIRVARVSYRWSKPLTKEKLVELGGRDSGLPAIAIRLHGRPLGDRGAIYLRHGEPDQWDRARVDPCGFWLYAREDLPDGEIGISFTDGRQTMVGSRGQFFGNDCNFTTIPRTSLGLEVHGRGPVTQRSDLPGIQSAALEDFEIGISTDTFEHEIEREIDVIGDPVTFARAGGGTEVSVYFAVPVEDVETAGERTRVRKGLVLYDRQGNEMERRTERVEAVVLQDPEEDGERRVLLDLFTLDLEPGTARIALQIDDLQGEGQGVWRDTVDVFAYPPGELGLSDIVFASSVTRDDSIPRFRRHGHTVLPVPSRTFRRGDTMMLYYETYHLAVGEGDRARFRVEYTVRADRLDRGALERLFGGLGQLVGVREAEESITFSFEREVAGPGTVVPEFIGLDTSRLEAGEYSLTLRIIDHEREDREVTKERTFNIVE